MAVHESGEMYLEAILVLSKQKNTVRSIDVSEYLSYSKPSVSRAMGLLKKEGYITIEKDGGITLQEEGKRVAEMIFERHTVLSKLLCSIGVEKSIATEDACKLEHAISDTSFQAIKSYMEKMSLL